MGIISTEYIPYKIELPYENTNYQIKVYKNNTERISKVFKAKSTDNTFAYPTLCKDKLYINIANQESNYSIIDQNGKIVTQGKLPQLHNIIDVHTLANGAYFLILTNDMQQKQNIKFVKE